MGEGVLYRNRIGLDYGFHGETISDYRRTMMAKREYTVEKATAMIEKNRGKAKLSTKIIYHRDPGCGVLGAIDYITRVHKYYWTRREEK